MACVGYYIRGTLNEASQIASSALVVRPLVSFSPPNTASVWLQWGRYKAEDSIYGTDANNASIFLPLETLWAGTRRWKLNVSNQPTLASMIGDAEPGFPNMGTQEALTDFCTSVFQFDVNTKNYLTIYGHGGPPNIGFLSLLETFNFDLLARLVGAQKKKFNSPDVDHRYRDRTSPMTLLEVGNALRKAVPNSAKFDVLFLSQCLMATLETAYEYREVTRYFVASQPLLSVASWNHTALLELLCSDHQPNEVIEKFLSVYKSGLKTNDDYSALVVTDMKIVDALVFALKQLVLAVLEEKNPALIKAVAAARGALESQFLVDRQLGLIDLVQFLNCVRSKFNAIQVATFDGLIDAVASRVQASVQVASHASKFSGMSIVFPWTDQSNKVIGVWDSYRQDCSFGTEHSWWPDFVNIVIQHR